MLDVVLKTIVKEYSKSADDLIKYDVYSRIDKDNFEFLRKILDMKEHHLQYVQCNDCSVERPVKTKENGNKFINCYDCGNLFLIKRNENIAYFLEFDQLANFVIDVLNIKNNKKNLEPRQLLYLGEKEITTGSNLYCDVYLVRNFAKSDIKNNCKQTTKKKPVFIIKLDEKEVVNDDVSVCKINDITAFDQITNKFLENRNLFYRILDGKFTGISKTNLKLELEAAFLAWFQSNKSSIKRGEKETIRIFAKSIFGITDNSFDAIWKKHAPKALKKQGRIKS